MAAWHRPPPLAPPCALAAQAPTHLRRRASHPWAFTDGGVGGAWLLAGLLRWLQRIAPVRGRGGGGGHSWLQVGDRLPHIQRACVARCTPHTAGRSVHALQPSPTPQCSPSRPGHAMHTAATPHRAARSSSPGAVQRAQQPRPPHLLAGRLPPQPATYPVARALAGAAAGPVVLHVSELGAVHPTVRVGGVAGGEDPSLVAIECWGLGPLDGVAQRV
jgi:hypothetical protein